MFGTRARKIASPSGSRELRRLSCGLVLLVLVLGALSSCGSRTGLLPGRVPCTAEGLERSCENACGEGTQVCEDGFFTECAVPVTSRSCENDCGRGTQQCEDGEWGECEVGETLRACTNLCGQGVQTCTDDTWGECRVAPVEGGCENICGSGTRTCENGAWGACRVAVAEEPCQNLCGSGTQRCENGVFGPCEVPVQTRDCRSVCGPGHESCVGGAWLPCDAPLPNPPRLQTIIRDFRIDHPDFELPNAPNAVEVGIVQDELGPDDKPVYNGHPLLGTNSTTGPENFAQWFNDVPGVNLSAALALELISSAENPSLFVYEDTSFFPIDGQLFGNETNRHNYHFTLEAKTTFQYFGGEVFRFTGDDDMWVFINRRLAIDLGGLHEPQSQSVQLDAIAGSHGLAIGGIYPLHFFFAERHTIESNFTIETSIAEPGSCD